MAILGILQKVELSASWLGGFAGGEETTIYERGVLLVTEAIAA